MTKDQIKTITEINAVTWYGRDSQQVYDAKKAFTGGEHPHYWSWWHSCSFGGGRPADGIHCFICLKPWEDSNDRREA